MTIIMEGAIGNVAITATHAPHADAEEEVKKSYYENLHKTHATHGKQSNVHFIAGDFNARILERGEAEEDIIGPHIFNPDNEGT